MCECGGAQVVSETGSFTGNKLGWGEDAPSQDFCGQIHLPFTTGPKAISSVQPCLISSMEHTLIPKMQVKNPSSKHLRFLDYSSTHTER